MEKNKAIRLLDASELQMAMDLAWKVFSEYQAPRLPDEAVEEMWATLDYEYMLHRYGDGSVRLWGAFDDGRMVGMCVIRGLSYLQLLYVDGEYQGQGVGTNLLKQAVLDCKKQDEWLDHLTVSAPITAAGFFEKLGFAATGDEEVLDGMAVVPMLLQGKTE